MNFQSEVIIQSRTVKSCEGLSCFFPLFSFVTKDFRSGECFGQVPLMIHVRTLKAFKSHPVCLGVGTCAREIIFTVVCRRRS